METLCLKCDVHALRRVQEAFRNGVTGEYPGLSSKSSLDLNLSEMSPVVLRLVQYSPSNVRLRPPILKIAAPS
jgi:hypothetical protein